MYPHCLEHPERCQNWHMWNQPFHLVIVFHVTYSMSCMDNYCRSVSVYIYIYIYIYRYICINICFVSLDLNILPTLRRQKLDLMVNCLLVIAIVVTGVLVFKRHTTGKPMKEVTRLLLCLCKNGHRSAALARQPFMLLLVFVQAAVIRSW